MIQISKFSRESGSQLADSIAQFKVPENPPKDKRKIWFLSGDMTQYGHKDVKMSQTGYDLVKKSIEDSCTSFKDNSIGDNQVRQALAHALSDENTKLTYNNIILTHGANVGLLHSILALASEGENILIPEPSYPFYHKVSKALGVQARPYKLLPENQWEIDLEYLQTLIDEKTKFIWVVNPSNPCASVFSKQHLQDILAVARKHKKLVISDEVYYNETFDNVAFTSMGNVAGDQPVIVIGGMEKTFCVPGWCVSWMAFYDKNKRLVKAQQSIKSSARLINSPPEFISSALPEMLDKLTLNFTKNLMPIFQESYSHIYEKIAKINGLKPIKAQGTFYLSVLIEVEKFKGFKNDIEFLQKLLDEQNIFILSLSCFGGGVNGFRLMTAAPLQYYEGFIENLTSFCDKYRSE